MTTKFAMLKFKAEADIIGRLLVGYTDLELSLALCTIVAGNDFDTVIKAMYTTRGEKARIECAERFGVERYKELGLIEAFAEAVSNMHKCRCIRNQYSHVIWWDDYGEKLGFANLEEVARRDDEVRDFKDLTRRLIDVPLLQMQEAFFQYTDELLVWINWEGRALAKKVPRNPHQRPAPFDAPPLFLA